MQLSVVTSVAICSTNSTINASTDCPTELLCYHRSSGSAVTMRFSVMSSSSMSSSRDRSRAVKPRSRGRVGGRSRVTGLVCESGYGTAGCVKGNIAGNVGIIR